MIAEQLGAVFHGHLSHAREGHGLFHHIADGIGGGVRLQVGRQSLSAASLVHSVVREANTLPTSVTCYRLTEYLVNAPPAWVSEFGPSAA